MLPNWLRSVRRYLGLRSTATRPACRRAPRRHFVLQALECLEDRIVPSFTLSTLTQPADTINVAYANQTITASGGTGNVTLALNVTNAIPGLSVTGNGTSSISVSGTPTAVGTETFTVTGTDDASDTTGPVNYTIAVNPAITLGSSTQTLIATSYVTNAVYEIDANTGALLATLVAPNSQSILMGPAGVTIGPDGNLYITGEGYNGSSFTGPYNIVEYNFSTQTLSTFITGAQMQAANGGVPFAPGGIAFGPDGNLYTDNTLPGAGADQVIRFGITNNDGQLSYNGTNLTLATGLSVACDITFGANPGDQGNLYVSDDNSVLKITGATTNTPASSLFVSAGSGGLTYSCGLTWQGGNLYDTDPGSGQVLEYDANGNFIKDFTGSALQNPNQQPINTLFLPNGNVVTSAFGPGSGFLVAAQGNEAGADAVQRQRAVAAESGRRCVPGQRAGRDRRGAGVHDLGHDGASCRKHGGTGPGHGQRPVHPEHHAQRRHRFRHVGGQCHQCHPGFEHHGQRHQQRVDHRHAHRGGHRDLRGHGHRRPGWHHHDQLHDHGQPGDHAGQLDADVDRHVVRHQRGV